MPSQHRFPVMTIRVDPDLRNRAKTAVDEVDSNLTAHIVEFLRWLVGDIDDLPARPSAAGEPPT